MADSRCSHCVISVRRQHLQSSFTPKKQSQIPSHATLADRPRNLVRLHHRLIALETFRSPPHSPYSIPPSWSHPFPRLIRRFDAWIIFNIGFFERQTSQFGWGWIGGGWRCRCRRRRHRRGGVLRLTVFYCFKNSRRYTPTIRTRTLRPNSVSSAFPSLSLV